MGMKKNTPNSKICRLIDNIPTHFWVRSLEHLCKTTDPLLLEATIQGKAERFTDLDFKEGLSGKFYGYIKKRTPSSGYIQLVADKYPGTEKIFTLPLWRILANPEASIEEVYEYMELLEADIRNHLFRPSKKTKLERRKFRGLSQISNIAKHHSTDALAALLLIIRETAITQQWFYHIEAKWELNDLLVRLSIGEPPNVDDLMEKLSSLIYVRFIQTSKPLPTYLKDPETDEYPFAYLGPINPPQIIEKANYYRENQAAFFFIDEEYFSSKINFLDSVLKHQKFYQRDELTNRASEKYVEYNSDMSGENQHWHSVKNSGGDQFHQNTQLRALDENAHKTGKG